MANIVNYVAKTNWATNETVKPTDYNKVEQGIKDNNDGLKALNTEVGGLPTLVANKVDKVDIVDNLTTSDASKVLSAKQGKLLNDNKINISSIVNNLTSTSTNVPLSANQGRLLDVNKVSISSIVDNLNSNVSTVPLSAKQGKVLNDNKVDKVTGKGLSTNDFTNEDKNNLTNLVNDYEEWTSSNGIRLTRVGKNVTVYVPFGKTTNDLPGLIPSSFRYSSSSGNYIHTTTSIHYDSDEEKLLIIGLDVGRGLNYYYAVITSTGQTSHPITGLVFPDNMVFYYCLP